MERYKVYGCQLYDQTSLRFNVSIRTADGLWYIRGWRLMKQNNKMLAPSYRAATFYIPIVKLPKNARAAIKKKAIYQRRKLLDSVNIDLSNAYDTELSN